MKLSFIFLLALCAILAACASTPLSPSSGNLTTEKAQNALNKFIKKGNAENTVTIKGGVREIPMQNIAVAEFQFDNYQFKDARGNLRGITSGSGDATFTHYTDGRWVLSDVNIKDGNYTQNFTPNIEAN